MRRSEKERRRERTVRMIRRIGSLRLDLNPVTMKMEPVEDQDREVLQVVQTVREVQELHRCNRKTGK